MRICQLYDTVNLYLERSLHLYFTHRYTYTQHSVNKCICIHLFDVSYFVEINIGIHSPIRAHTHRHALHAIYNPSWSVQRSISLHFSAVHSLNRVCSLCSTHIYLYYLFTNFCTFNLSIFCLVLFSNFQINSTQSKRKNKHKK